MSAFVLINNYKGSIDNKFYPNIHGHLTRYNGGVIESSYTTQGFDNLKSRYINAIKAQLLSQNEGNDEQVLEAIKNIDEESLMNLEYQLVSSYNTMVANAEGLSEEFVNNVKNIRQVLESSKRQADKQKEAVESLDKIVEAFKEAGQEAGLAEAIVSKKKFQTNLQDLIKYQKLKAAITQQSKKGYSAQQLTSLLTQASEALPVFLAECKEKNITKIDDVFKNTTARLLGSKGDKVIIKEINTDKKFLSKATDLMLKTNNYTLHIKSDPASEIFEHTIIATPYATVKQYENEGAVKLSTFSGSNSILIPYLKHIYKNWNKKLEYQIYNSLAFKSQDYIGADNKGGELDRNFRILRSDIIANTAERYIIGYQQNKLSQLLIYNGKAYSILSILCEIVKDYMNSERKATNSYGSLSQGDIFTVGFTPVGNKWVKSTIVKNNKGINIADNKAKAKRIEKVYNDINRLYTGAKIRLDKIMNNLDITHDSSGILI